MIRRGGGYTAPIPGRDPGACPDCGSWRKAGMIHECDDAEQALPDGVRSAIAVYVAVVADEDASESAVLEADQALAEQIQRTDQAFEEVARLREFGEHYSGAAQDAWDRIGVLEKALRQVKDNAESWHGNGEDGPRRALVVIARWCDEALAAGSAADRNEPVDLSSEVCGDRAESQFGGGRRCCHLRAGHDGPHRDRHLRWSDAETWSDPEKGRP